MIIQICQGQEELALSIEQPGCNGVKLADLNVRLVIEAPHCEWLLKSPWYRTGCWPGNEPREPLLPPHEMSKLVYPASYINNDGDIVFRLDSLLFNRPPGRYLGKLFFFTGQPITELDLDLCTRPFFIGRVTAKGITCGSDCDG